MRIFAAFILQQQHGLLFVSAFAVFLTLLLLMSSLLFAKFIAVASPCNASDSADGCACLLLLLPLG
jgi:hypothetical protein